MQRAPNNTSGQPTSHLTDEILDKRETAKRIRKSVRTVDAWMKDRKLPYIKVGRTVMFRWSAILERLESFRVN
jgi:predicted DNA-binding transcriptional regulator AlpA